MVFANQTSKVHKGTFWRNFHSENCTTSDLWSSSERNLSRCCSPNSFARAQRKTLRENVRKIFNCFSKNDVHVSSGIFLTSFFSKDCKTSDFLWCFEGTFLAYFSQNWFLHVQKMLMSDKHLWRRSKTFVFSRTCRINFWLMLWKLLLHIHRNNNERNIVFECFLTLIEKFCAGFFCIWFAVVHENVSTEFVFEEFCDFRSFFPKFEQFFFRWCFHNWFPRVHENISTELVKKFWDLRTFFLNLSKFFWLAFWKLTSCSEGQFKRPGECLRELRSGTLLCRLFSMSKLTSDSTILCLSVFLGDTLRLWTGALELEEELIAVTCRSKKKALKKLCRLTYFIPENCFLSSGALNIVLGNYGTY